jgi:hypothetical protein
LPEPDAHDHVADEKFAGTCDDGVYRALVEVASCEVPACVSGELRRRK